MIVRDRLRGQPLAMLVLVLGGWVVLRAVTWEPPAWTRDAPDGRVRALSLARTGAGNDSPQAAASSGGASYRDEPQGGYWLPVPRLPYWQSEPRAVAPQPMWFDPLRPPSVVINHPPAAAHAEPRGQEPLLAAGHQLMWMASLARVALPPELAGYLGGQPAPATPAPASLSPASFSPVPLSPIPLSPGLAEKPRDRWSADAWMLMRRQTPSGGAGARPLYGGSQIGAVVRYHLDPQGGHRPLAYLRGSHALGAIRESELAAGLGARPLAGFPLVVAGEARAFRTGSKTTFRPAALAYTELQPVELPLELRGEAYLQGGYVGGRYKTPFIDGQIRLDRRLGDFGLGELRVGGGIWGGAQKGAGRLDAGPGATAMVDLGGTPSRVSMDWRFRLAGDAEPGSGPAVTVSAGF